MKKIDLIAGQIRCDRVAGSEAEQSAPSPFGALLVSTVSGWGWIPIVLFTYLGLVS